MIRTRSILVLIVVAASLAMNGVPAPAVARRGPAAPPIRHVVVLFMENHSFDNVLGRLCARSGRCDGATTGRLADGTRIDLTRASDVVPDVGHFRSSQTTAIDDGEMDGFSRIGGCHAHSSPPYRCYTQFHAEDIPNLWRLARRFTISDATFEDAAVPSWGSHLDLVAQTLDGFTGDNPPDKDRSGPGWGCESRKDAPWRPSRDAETQLVPACVPWHRLDPSRYPYGGAYRRTPVEHVDTLMDRMTAADVTWRIYQHTTDWTTSTAGGYGWAICPTFADCFYTSQRNHMRASNDVIVDARAGRLPAVSLVMPPGEFSQHNLWSMAAGDAWIGKIVGAIEQGPDWRSTTIFITYDDCGCFYDHVAPPKHLGIRVPMVIVGPYVRQRHTDHATASYASIAAYIERNFALRPLGAHDANAYAYRGSFDYSQRPLDPVPMERTVVPASSLREIAANPPEDDET